MLYKPMSRAVLELLSGARLSEALCEKAGCAHLWTDARALSVKTEHSPPSLYIFVLAVPSASFV